jgi:hypothetical protein
MTPNDYPNTLTSSLRPTFGGPHVVLLGAGASRATCPGGDRHGRRLPLMDDLVETVGLRSLVDERGLTNRAADFEGLYSCLFESRKHDDVLYTMESIIHTYFAQLELPENPTLYDHMLLCLRHKDVIATFNWDPLLPEALHRVAKRFGQDILPQAFFLHGNVSMGYCDKHKPPTQGFIGYRCGRCGSVLSRSDILFPVTRKDYTDDPFISYSWERLKECLHHAFIFTVFGYRAPRTDVEAVGLIKNAWGHGDSRELEEIEVIDIRPPQELYESWEAMICREHYRIMDDFYWSLAARHPRRSCEDLWEAIMRSNPQEDRPIPRNASWGELEDWVGPLLEREAAEEKRDSAGSDDARKGPTGTDKRALQGDR